MFHFLPQGSGITSHDKMSDLDIVLPPVCPHKSQKYPVDELSPAIVVNHFQEAHQNRVGLF